MGNACFRHSAYAPTTYLGSTRLKKTAPAPPSKVTTPLSLASHSNGGLSSDSMPAIGLGHLGDDCAINELLEGRMELDVVLPDSRQVRMTVERRTPMMDLLVQVTTANKISPGGHVIHILTDRGKDFLHYKPNTPIGSLDTNTVYIVPKSAIIDPPVKKMPKVVNKPFEQTFRLQVSLPHGQLMVLRVSPRTTLAEVKQMACSEKNLDYSRYQLVDTRFPNQIMDLNSRMEDYGSTEITLMSNSSINANIRNSTTDLIAYSARDEDKKKKGILGLFSRKKSKGSTADSSSDSMDSRGVSPSRGEDIRRISAKSGSKKRPAPLPPPPPPVIVSPAKPSVTTTAIEKTPPKSVMESIDSTTVSHSRHSSDSSGYHEASVLSDSPENPPPEIGGRTAEQHHARKTSTPTKPTQQKPVLSKASSYSENALWSTASKKRKAPPPPPASIPPPSEVTVVEPFISAAISSFSTDEEDSPIVEEPPVVEVTVHANASESSSPTPTSSPPLSIEEEPIVVSPTPPPEPLPHTSRTSSPVHLDSGIVLEDGDSLTDDLSVNPEFAREPENFPLDKGDAVSEDWPEFDLEDPLGFTNPSLSTIHNFRGGGDSPEVASPESYWEASNPALKRRTNRIREFAFSTSGSGGLKHTSHTSLNTIADIENVFEQMIAEAQRSLEENEEPLPRKQDELPSPIVETVEIPKEVVTPVADQDDLGWEYTIPDPPPAFRNDEEVRERSDSDGSSRGYKIPPPLPGLPPPAMVENHEASSSSSSDSEEQNSPVVVSREFVAPKPRRPLLQNFTFGTYKAPKEDILAVLSNEPPKMASYSQVQVAKEDGNDDESMPTVHPKLLFEKRSKSIPVDDRLLGGLDGSLRGFKGQVKLRCAEMKESGPSGALVSRCKSMMDVNRKVEIEELPRKSVQRSTSGLEQLRRKAQSVQNLNGLREDEDDPQLQEDYSKLHRQFLDWNQKLKANQVILEKQKNVVAVSNTSKAQTLPRPPKTKFTEAVAESGVSTTLERPRSQYLANVTIGSWQQRKSTENLTTVVPSQSAVATRSKPDQPLAAKQRPVSLYGVPKRNAITAQVIASQAQAKPKIDIIQFSNYDAKSSSVLRTSSQKTAFRPPEVRFTTNSRQRVPPVATKEEPIIAPRVNGFAAVQQEPTFREPPPLPQVPIVSKPPILKSVGKRQCSSRTLAPPKLEPREELMLEIRNFGGRHALRKIPTNQINSWQLKVYGNSSVNA